MAYFFGAPPLRGGSPPSPQEDLKTDWSSPGSFQTTLYGYRADRYNPPLLRAQKEFKWIPNQKKVVWATRRYFDWVRDKFQMVFKDPGGGLVVTTAKKRGNTVYRDYVHGRLHNDSNRFYKLLNKRYGFKRDNGTGALFLTLTYKTNTPGNGWVTVGKNFNNFITKFRSRFGKTYVIRVWESMYNGRCHIHALLLLENRVSSYMNKGKIWFSPGVWKRLNNPDLWPHGFSNWRGCKNVAGSYHHILKYVTKSQGIETLEGVPFILDKWENGDYLTKREGTILKAVMTNALAWIHSKRQYSISAGLNLIHRIKTNSNGWSFLGAPLWEMDDGYYPVDDPETVKFLYWLEHSKSST